MRDQKNRLYFFTLVLLFFVSVLSVTFGILMYRTNLLDTYGNLMRANVTDTIQKVHYGVSFGKTVENYYGLEELLEETVENADYVENLYVTEEKAGLLYSTDGGMLPEKLEYLKNDEQKVYQNKLYTAFSLTGDSMLTAETGMDTMNRNLAAFSGKLGFVSVLGLLAAAGIITAVWFTAGRRGKNGGRALSIVVVLWIILLGIYVGNTCWKEYRMSHKILAEGVEKSAMADIHKLEEEGIPYEELVDVEGYLSLYSDHIPEFEEVHLEDGRLQYTISANYMRTIFIQYLLNTILLSVISILIVTEYQLLLGAGKEGRGRAAPEQSHGMVRLAVFLLYACISIGKAVNATVSNQLALALSQKSADMLTSIPATTAMAGSLIGILLSRRISVLAGNMRRYLLAVAAAAAAGLLACGVSGNLYLFSAARAILGFCEGLLLIGIKNYAFSFQKTEERTRALSYVSGGGFGGICLGSVMGGMLCDHLDYQYVFLIAAVILLTLFPILKRIDFRLGAAQNTSAAGMTAVLKNPLALRYLVCLVLPVYAGAVFLDYVLPLVGSGYGFTHTVVSALILFNCLLAGYASPAMTRIALKIMSPVKGAICYCVLYGGMIFLYAVTGSPVLLAVVALALGLCDSFGLVLLSEGFVLTKGNRTYQDTEANILFTMTSRAGQLIAPGCIAWFGGCGILAGMTAAGLGIYGITEPLVKKVREKKYGHH